MNSAFLSLPYLQKEHACIRKKVKIFLQMDLLFEKKIDFFKTTALEN